jgi:membrane fusion protein (multidrug efflux system)
VSRAVAAGLSLALGLLLYCAHGCERAPEDSPPPGGAAIPVQVVRVQTGDIAEVLTVTGETAALSVLRMASPVAGRITMLAARPGDRLAAGEAVARVLPLENEAALHGLALLKGADTVDAGEKQATGRLQKEIAAREIVLRAPFSAVVADRLHNPGEQVAPNDVLVEVFDPTSLYVIAAVPVDAARRVAAGMPVEVVSGGTIIPGQVAALTGALVPQSLTLPVRVSLASPPQPPLLHAAVECRITVARHTDVLLIPPSALLSSRVADQGVVMVAENGVARQRPIRLGLRTPANVEVTQGLAAGEVVLTAGQFALPDGTRIQATGPQ